MKENLKMKKALILSLMLLSCNLVIGQNISDALRYSVLTPGGSARVLGAGNAFGAMGGDIGVTSINVAGIGDFRASEITASVSYNSPNTVTSFSGQQVGDSNNGNNFLIENLAYIKHNKPYASAFVTSNIAISFQQFNNYGQNFSYDTESIGSITEYFADQANFDGFYNFESELAFQTGAIFDDPDDDQGVFYYSDLFESDLTRKEQIVERSGSFNEFQVSWGGKLKSGLSIGAGVGIPLMSFEENKFYEENDVDGSPEGFNRLNFNETLTTSGSGINFRAGLGYSLKNKFRMGLAFQSPSWMRMEDVFYTSMIYDCEACNGTPLVESPTGSFTYNLRTPMKITGSIGGLINLSDVKGFLNLDVQYIDYRMNKFDLTGRNASNEDLVYESELNEEISSELTSGYNFTLGGELAYKRYRARAGFSAQLKPFNNEIGADNIYGTGLGYRGNVFYLDLAYQFRSLTEGYIPYEANTLDRDLFLRNEADLKKLVLTFGIKI